MAKYTYTAKDKLGNIIKGEADVKNEKELFSFLWEKNEVLIKCRTAKAKLVTYKMKPMEISEFSRQISDMLGSGIPITKALGIIRDCATSEKLLSVYEKLCDDVQDGRTLSEAMAQQGKAFPELFINMYSAGESSGKLQNTAKKMAVHYEKEYKLNSKVKSAMIYPTILGITTLVVIMLLFTFILPQFFTLFEGLELPLITKIVMGFSQFLSGNWLLVIIGILMLIVLCQWMLTVDEIRTWIDHKKITMPILGRLNKTIYTARFARTLSSLYSSGLSIINALETASTIIGNRYIQKQFPQAVAQIREGELLSQSIGEIDGFEKKISSTLIISEESGKLDTMLENMADNYDFEAQSATEKMVALMEPLMIIVMAVIICGVVLSVLLPLLGVYTSIG